MDKLEDTVDTTTMDTSEDTVDTTTMDTSEDTVDTTTVDTSEDKVDTSTVNTAEDTAATTTLDTKDLATLSTGCFLCGIPSTSPCPHCGLVYSCCSAHLSFHRPADVCFPFLVARDAVVGRHLVAARDIAPLELVLSEAPAVWAPYTKSDFQCLGCGKKAWGRMRCPACRYPMCSKKCVAGQMHRKECAFLCKLDPKLVEDDSEEDEDDDDSGEESECDEEDYYEDAMAVILPLRCLLLKSQNPTMWEIFMTFLSHCEERRQSSEALWQFHDGHSVDVLQQQCGMDFSREEIHRAIGIMLVNSVNMELAPTHGRATGFYPTFANLNHSCLANTKTVKLPDHRLEVRAQRAINKGEEISTEYVPADRPTHVRRALLRKKWFFWCACVRCRDPTENGAYLGALLCRRKGRVGECGGVVVPDHPLDPETGWSCRECGDGITDEEAKGRMAEAEKEVTHPDKRDDLVQHLEKFIYRQAGSLHPSNYINIDVMMKLGFLYGNCAAYPEKDLPRPLLERKLQVCQQVLNTRTKVDPGYTRWRGRVLGELNKARIAITRQNWQTGATSRKPYDKAKKEKQFMQVYQAFYSSILFSK